MLKELFEKLFLLSNREIVTPPSLNAATQASTVEAVNVLQEENKPIASTIVSDGDIAQPSTTSNKNYILQGTVSIAEKLPASALITSDVSGKAQHTKEISHIKMKVDPEILEKFNRICKSNGWTQKVCLEKLMQNFYDNHSCAIEENDQEDNHSRCKNKIYSTKNSFSGELVHTICESKVYKTHIVQSSKAWTQWERSFLLYWEYIIRKMRDDRSNIISGVTIHDMFKVTGYNYFSQFTSFLEQIGCLKKIRDTSARNQNRLIYIINPNLDFWQLVETNDLPISLNDLLCQRAQVPKDMTEKEYQDFVEICFA